MAEPLSLIAFGVIVTKFTEQAWDCGEKWIQSYFKDHEEKAIEKAKENTLYFLGDLAQRIKLLEEMAIITQEKINAALDHPDFSVVLQKAMISAAQTENTEKHQLLSRLVTERLKAEPESLIALMSNKACDVISYITPNQLNILGLIASIWFVKPDRILTEDIYFMFLLANLEKLSHVQPTPLDYIHLEALSCLKFEPNFSNNLISILKKKNNGNFNVSGFSQQPFGKSLIEIWGKYKLESAQLTSIGQMIGFMASEQITGEHINLDRWIES